MCNVGRVFVGFKESVFEPSSPMRHMCELNQVMQSEFTAVRPVLFIYSDGGSDHRLTYISVQLSLISLFLRLDLDYLCACRTAPYHSWRNPVERVMSVLNLGLQCVALARAKMTDSFEKEVSKCNTLSELRKIAVRNADFTAQVHNSLSPVKLLLSEIFSRLKLHDETIRTFVSATPTEISDFWTSVIAIDSSLKENIQYTKKTFETEHIVVAEFITHCCCASQYSFDILKCGNSSCNLCKPVRLPIESFSKLKHLPHPMPGDDGHYIAFSDVFGSNTTEEHRPSLAKKSSGITQKKGSTKKNTLPFYGTVQHVRNAALVLQCEECGLWRLIYSKYKLKKNQREQLQRILDDVIYTCGSKLRDLHLPDQFSNVEVKDHLCGDPIEKSYYSAKFDPICVYCGSDQPFTSDNTYPQCSECIDKEPIKKK